MKILQPLVGTNPKIVNATHLIKFYGIKCLADLSDNSVELIGKTKISHWFLNIYLMFIFHVKDVYAFTLSLFTDVPSELSGLNMAILGEIRDLSDKDREWGDEF